MCGWVFVEGVGARRGPAWASGSLAGERLSHRRSYLPVSAPTWEVRHRRGGRGQRRELKMKGVGGGGDGVEAEE